MIPHHLISTPNSSAALDIIHPVITSLVFPDLHALPTMLTPMPFIAVILFWLQYLQSPLHYPVHIHWTITVSKYWYQCLEYTGKDADEMYEDIGHSNEARKTMKKYLIGNLEVRMFYCHDQTVPIIWFWNTQGKLRMLLMKDLYTYFQLLLWFRVYSDYDTQYNVIIITVKPLVTIIIVTIIINIWSFSILKVDPLKPKKGGMKKVATGALPSSGGLNPIAILVLLVAIACGVYFSQIKK